MSYYEKMLKLLPGQFRLESYDSRRICEFICESVKDLDGLPEDCEMGSVARIIEPPAIYRKNSSGRWIVQQSSEPRGGGLDV